MRKKMIFKIILAFIATITVVRFLSISVFLADSPQLRPDAGSAITMVFGGIIDSITTPLARLFSTTPDTSFEQKLANIPLSKVSTGVYAKDAGNVSYVEFRAGEVMWKEYETTVNGKKVTVKIVEGATPPSQAAIESFLNKVQ